MNTAIPCRYLMNFVRSYYPKGICAQLSPMLYFFIIMTFECRQQLILLKKKNGFCDDSLPGSEDILEEVSRRFLINEMSSSQDLCILQWVRKWSEFWNMSNIWEKWSWSVKISLQSVGHKEKSTSISNSPLRQRNILWWRIEARQSYLL